MILVVQPLQNNLLIVSLIIVIFVFGSMMCDDGYSLEQREKRRNSFCEALLSFTGSLHLNGNNTRSTTTLKVDLHVKEASGWRQSHRGYNMFRRKLPERKWTNGRQ